LAAVNDVINSKAKKYVAIIDALKHDHVTAAKEAVQNDAVRSRLVSELDQEFTHLRAFLDAAQARLRAVAVINHPTVDH
jgi:hypothetical protein